MRQVKMHTTCLQCLLLMPCLFLKQTGRCYFSLFSEQSESQWWLVRISKCGATVCYPWVVLLPLRFQDCRKLSEDVQNAILAVATVYYWLPKGQGEIMTARQSPLYRLVVLSEPNEVWYQQVFIGMVSLISYFVDFERVYEWSTFLSAAAVFLLWESDNVGSGVVDWALKFMKCWNPCPDFFWNWEAFCFSSNYV